MTGDRRRRLPGVLLSGCFATVLATVAPSAAGPGDPETGARTASAGQEAPAPDFFLGRPRGWVGARGGWLLAAADSDLFDFIEKQLTLDDGDFRAASFGFSAGFMLTRRVDLVLAVEFSRSSASSEFRDYVDENFLPITQRTELNEAEVSFSATYALAPRFRQVSRFASVLRRVVPYVGGGAGLLHHELKQTGDFVDFTDLSIFTTTLQSTGWTPSVHVMGGLDFQLYRSWFATAEARYTWADSEPGLAFVGFDPMDLSGFRFSVGVNYVF